MKTKIEWISDRLVDQSGPQLVVEEILFYINSTVCVLNKNYTAAAAALAHQMVSAVTEGVLL